VSGQVSDVTGTACHCAMPLRSHRKYPTWLGGAACRLQWSVLMARAAPVGIGSRPGDRSGRGSLPWWDRTPRSRRSPATGIAAREARSRSGSPPVGGSWRSGRRGARAPPAVLGAAQVGAAQRQVFPQGPL